MTPCPCPIDHWLWVVNGLYGIVSMVEALDGAGIRPSGEALNRLKGCIARLTEQSEKQAKRLEEAK